MPGGEPAGYASIAIVQTGAVKQYATFLQKGVVGVDARTGAFLWRDNRTADGSAANIPTPVVSGSGVYNATNQGGGALVKLAVAAGKVTAQPAYHERRLPGSNGGSIVLDGYLYGTNATSLLCVEFATGAVKWQERGIGTASLAYADGRLYLRGEERRRRPRRAVASRLSREGSLHAARGAGTRTGEGLAASRSSRTDVCTSATSARSGATTSSVAPGDRQARTETSVTRDVAGRLYCLMRLSGTAGFDSRFLEARPFGHLPRRGPASPDRAVRLKLP